MVSRRALLKGLLAFAAGSTALAGYAFGIEPMWRLRVQSYRIRPPRWPDGLRIRATLIADLHAGEPQMPVSRVREIVARANALEPDVHLLLGDYQASHRMMSRKVEPAEWAPQLSALKAPLGVHAILGNHDWWDDPAAQRAGRGPVIARRALEASGISVYENDAVRLTKDGRSFWLAGLGDQLALFERRWRPDGESLTRPLAQAGFVAPSRASSISGTPGRRLFGVDDLPSTLAKITDDAPVILMAHEPDIFPQVADRVSLTVSGHTHGGQLRLLGWSPVVPSQYGNRYAYGHVIEDQRHLVVSGGLGCSIVPVRLGVPPEIVVLDIGGGPA